MPPMLTAKLRAQLAATSLWLVSSQRAFVSAQRMDKAERDAAKAWGFGQICDYKPGEALATAQTGQHLVIDLSLWPDPAKVLAMLPLDHLLPYAFRAASPLVGLRYDPHRSSMQMNADLTIAAHDDGGACPAGLVPAGIAAIRAEGPAELQAALALVQSPKLGLKAKVRGYPLALAGPYDPSRKAIFLDRDGVINVDSGYGHKPEDFQFVPGAVEFLQQRQAEGWRLVILTNQAGVAKGKFSLAVAEDYHRYIVGRLKAEGVAILASALCPYHQEGSVAAYRGASILRKPQPGMALSLASEQRLALPHSIMIGDKDSDRLRLPGLTPYILKGRYALDAALPHYDSFAAIAAALPRP